MTSCQCGLCCFWRFHVYLNGECVYLRLCGIHMWKILYLLLLWLLIRPDLCSVGAQYRHSQRSSWSNEQTCLKRSRSVDIHSNTFSMVSSQSDHFFFGINWNIYLAAVRTAIGRGPFLLPGSETGNVLSALAGLCTSLLFGEGSELTYKSPLRKHSQLWIWEEVMLSDTRLPLRKSNEIKGIEDISDWLHLCRDVTPSAHSVLAWLEIAYDCFCTHTENQNLIWSHDAQHCTYK